MRELRRAAAVVLCAAPVAPAAATVTHIRGGRTFAGRTSQGRAIHFHRRGGRLYDMTFSVQCAGTPATVRVRPIVLRRGRFGITFATGALNGILRGQVGRSSASGALSAQGKECATGLVTWRAVGR